MTLPGSYYYMWKISYVYNIVLNNILIPTTCKRYYITCVDSSFLWAGATLYDLVAKLGYSQKHIPRRYFEVPEIKANKNQPAEETWNKGGCKNKIREL